MTDITINLKADDNGEIRWQDVSDAIASQMRQRGPVRDSSEPVEITAPGITGQVTTAPDGMAPRIGRTVIINSRREIIVNSRRGVARAIAGLDRGTIVGLEPGIVVIRLADGTLFRALPSNISFTDYP